MLPSLVVGLQVSFRRGCFEDLRSLGTIAWTLHVDKGLLA